MYIKHINMHHFRNIEHASLEFIDGLNIFSGKNGQGKTNALEALQLALNGKSHRERTTQNFIKEGCDNADLQLTLKHDDSTQTDVELKIGSVKQFFVDDEAIKRRTQLLRAFSIVFFSPEDLYLVKGSPSLRRTFLDEAIVSIAPQYAEILSGYYQVLAQKNSLLKEYRPSSASLLEVYNDSMVQNGSLIMKYRIRFLRQFSQQLIRYYREISEDRETLNLSYASMIFQSGQKDDIEKTLRKAIDDRMQEEIQNRSCLVGPHLDDLHLTLDERNSRKFASQGQQRTIALCMKLALIDLFQEKNKERPIVLLDDVMSELDMPRQQMILSVLANVQTFITCVTTDFLPAEHTANSYRVENGQFTKI